MSDTVYPPHPNLNGTPAGMQAQNLQNPYMVQQLATPVPQTYPMPNLPQSFQGDPQNPAQTQPGMQAHPQVGGPLPIQAQQPTQQQQIQQQPAQQQPAPQVQANYAPASAVPTDTSFLEDVRWSNFKEITPQASTDLAVQAQAQQQVQIQQQVQQQVQQGAHYPAQAYQANPAQIQDVPQHHAAQAYAMPASAMPASVVPGAMMDGAQQDEGKPKSLFARFKRSRKKDMPQDMPASPYGRAQMPSNPMQMQNLAQPAAQPFMHAQSTMDNMAVENEVQAPAQFSRATFLKGMLAGLLLGFIALTLLGKISAKKEYGVVAKVNQNPVQAVSDAIVSVDVKDVAEQLASNPDLNVPAFIDQKLDVN